MGQISTQRKKLELEMGEGGVLVQVGFEIRGKS